LLPQYAENESVEQRNNLLTIQPKLTIGSPDDPYEREADSVANHVMRMPMDGGFIRNGGPSEVIQRKCASCENEEEAPQPPIGEFVQRKPFNTIPKVQLKCAACEHEEEKIQKKPFNITPFIQKSGADGGGMASDTVTNKIESSRGGGNAMSDHSRSFMESRFGMDFSGVKIHTDSNANNLSQQLNAQAFTVGKDIYFNEGKYNPDSDSGRHLLAHELTHTVQQSKGEIKPKIQRSAYWVGIDGSKEMTGTHIHNSVLKEFGKKNSNLFTEAPVPNATLVSTEFGKEGSADFYLASTTVGLKFNEHFVPANFPTDRRGKLSNGTKGIKKGGKSFDHIANAAPIMKDNKIDLSNAPSSIKVGDLKPYGAPLSDEEYQEQISAYLGGFRLTRDQINEIAVNAKVKHVINPAGGSWHPNIEEMDNGDAQIPDKFRIGSTSAPSHRIILKHAFGKHFLDQTIMGRLHIAYRKDMKGIWNYIWVPDPNQNITAASLPANITAQSITVNNLITPLTDVNIQPKLKNKGLDKKIQRKKDKSGFDFEKWKLDQKKLQDDYKSVPEADKKTADAKVASHQVSKQMFNHFGTIPGFENGIDSSVETANVQLVKRLKFWSNPFSVVVGWLREKFGGTFVKIYLAVQKIKKKVKDIVAKTKATISKGGIVGAVIKVFIKGFKMLGVYLVNKTIDLVLNAITSGFTKKIQQFIESLVPDEVEEEIARLKKIQDDYEKKALETVDELLERFVGHNLKDFEDFAEVMKIAETANTIISLVRWGARLLACASPPAIGCLWIIAEAVLEEIAAKVIESCWFIKKVIPKLADFDVIISIPNKIANHIIATANELMPTGWNDTFLPVPESALGYDGNFTPECGGSGEPFNEKRQEIIDLIEAIGEERFLALMELFSKRGAGPWVLLDAERVNLLKNSALKDLDPQTLRDIANDKTKEIPIQLSEFLENIKTYTKKETTTKKKFFEDKAAREAKLAEEKGKGAGSSPETGKGAGTGAKEGEGGITYKIIKTPIAFDKSKSHAGTIQDLTIKEEKSKVVSEGNYNASVNVSINGNLINVPDFRVHVDFIMQILTSGEQAPPTYHLSIPEDVFIKFSTGETFKLNGMQVSENYIKFVK
jgi:hypothetical protein